MAHSIQLDTRSGAPLLLGDRTDKAVRHATSLFLTTARRTTGLLAMLVASFGLIVHTARPGAAQSADADSATLDHAYRPCPPGHDIDIVVMMDASGSLNSRTSGADPSGRHRRTALQTLRDVLANNLESSALGDMEDLLPDTSDTGDTINTADNDEPLIRAALYYFNATATHVTGFSPISSAHPSDDSIEEALQLGRRGNTNYDAALEAAIAAFAEADAETVDAASGLSPADATADAAGATDSKADAAGAARGQKCRVLLFFTDGIYDPDGRVGKRSLTETTAADLTNQLRRNVCPRDRENRDDSDSDNDGETATTISDRFRELGIQTYAVLLSESFLSVLTDTSDGNATNRSVAAASLQALRGLTSDPGSQFDEHVADHPDCPVDPNRQHGKIISILGLTDLEIALIEAVETASESAMLSWHGCISTESEPGIRSSEALPDGRFIDAIALYPVGGRISEYRLRGTDGSEWEKLEGQSRLLLEGEKHLRHLRSGWNLDVKLDPNPGGSSDDMALRCYATPAERPLNPVEAEIRTAAGGPAEVLYMRNKADADTPVFGEDYELVLRQADGGRPEVCTAGIEWAGIDDPLSGERIRLDLSGCTASDSLLRVQGYQPICGESFDAGMNLNGSAQPEHTENIFPPSLNAEQFALPAATSHAARVNCPGAPRLSDCSTELEITNIQAEVPREPLRGEAWCTLRLPDEGRVLISGVWEPDASFDLPGPLEWRIAEARIGDTAPLTVDAPLMNTEGTDDSTTVAELAADGAEVIVYAEFADLAGNGNTDATTATDATAAADTTAADTKDLPVHLVFVTENELANTGWDIEGHLKLIPVWDWDPGNPQSNEAAPSLRGHYLSVDAAFQGRSNSLWTWIITVTMLVSSLLVSYLLLCWVLTRNLTLPDARGFWVHRVPLHVSRGLNGRLSLTTDPVGVPLGAQGLLRGKARRGGHCMELSTRSSTGEQLRISLRRAAFLNLPGLLRGGWAELHAPSKFVGANRKGPRSSTAQLDFTQLTIVELQPSSINETVHSAAWFLEPKKGPHSGRDHAPINEVRQVIDNLAREIADDDRTDDDSIDDRTDDDCIDDRTDDGKTHADQRDNRRDDRHADSDHEDGRHADYEDRHSNSDRDHTSGRSTTTGPPPPGRSKPRRSSLRPRTPPPPGRPKPRRSSLRPRTPPPPGHHTTGPPPPPGRSKPRRSSLRPRTPPPPGRPNTGPPPPGQR